MQWNFHFSVYPTTETPVKRSNIGVSMLHFYVTCTFLILIQNGDDYTHIFYHLSIFLFDFNERFPLWIENTDKLLHKLRSLAHGLEMYDVFVFRNRFMQVQNDHSMCTTRNRKQQWGSAQTDCNAIPLILGTIWLIIIAPSVKATDSNSKVKYEDKRGEQIHGPKFYIVVNARDSFISNLNYCDVLFENAHKFRLEIRALTRLTDNKLNILRINICTLFIYYTSCCSVILRQLMSPWRHCE